MEKKNNIANTIKGLFEGALKNSTGEFSGKKVAGWLVLLNLLFLINAAVFVSAFEVRWGIKVNIQLLDTIIEPLIFLIVSFFAVKLVENMGGRFGSKKNDQE